MNRSITKIFTQYFIAIGLLIFVVLIAVEVNASPESEVNSQNMPDKLNKALAEIELSTEITSVQQKYQESDAIMLQFTLKNMSQSKLHILEWGTPFEGFKNDMFMITCNDTPIPYHGMLVKRGSPQESDYFLIEPESEKTIEIDLAEGYTFQDDGNCQVAVSLILLDVQSEPLFFSPLGEYHQVKLPMANTEFILQGKRSASTNIIDSPTDFIHCSESEQQDVIAAFESAQNMATNSLNSLQSASDPENAARYITWFGPHTSERYTTVQTHFSSISNALNTQTFDWDCNPDPACPDLYAYVYANQPYKIYLCALFWATETTGTDSRPGVIIHEVSHFDAVAGTDDHFYGHGNSIVSAQNDPALAINNADSHEYFAENEPLLPMERVTNPVFIDFLHISTEIGTEHLPFNTLSEGVSQVESNGVVKMEAGLYLENLTISKPVELQSRNGTAIIGDP